MNDQQMINVYEEIIANLEPLLRHDLQAVRTAAQIQIDRINRNIRELKNNIFQQ